MIPTYILANYVRVQLNLFCSVFCFPFSHDLLTLVKNHFYIYEKGFESMRSIIVIIQVGWLVHALLNDGISAS
jgi:hypothetical protein